MKRNLPISQKKKFKYSITFQSFDEESLEAGDSFDRGYEVEDTIDLIGDILYKAYSTYGIYMPVAFGTWESTNPLENTDFYEKGIQKYFAIHITNEDGTQISQEENDFITFILSDGNYELNKFREYAVGGVVLGSIALGIGALITYFYFKGKKGNKSGSTNNRAKSITHTINGKDRKFPIKDAWKKEHTLENQSEEYEVPQEERFEMGGYASEHYHEIEYGEGGVAKAKEIIMKKIGFNEENANYLVSQSEKFSIWLADSILKQEIRRLNDLEKSVNRTNIIDKKSTLDFINKRNNHIQYGYSTPIREILDWLKHPITPKQDLKQLSFDQALIKSREWHNELQVLGGDIDYTEPETNTILKKYPVNSDGIEYYWVFIPSNYCKLEGSRMGHCGTTGLRNNLISLRSIKPYEKEHTINDSHILIAYGVDDGIFYQVKGKKNSKPAEKYFPYIFDLIKSAIKDNDIKYSKTSNKFDKNNKLTKEEKVLEFNGFGSEYGQEEDYGFEEMTKEQIREIFDLKPTLFESGEDNLMLFDKGVITLDEFKKIIKDNDNLFGFAEDYYMFLEKDVITLDELKEIVERKPDVFSSFGNQMNLYVRGIITEQPSTTFELKYDCDDVYRLLDISRDFSDDLVAQVLCGDVGELSDGFSYYYDNPSDLISNLNKENEQKVIDEIVRITKLDESIVKENGIEYYLNGDDENFSPNDDFDNIIRSLASAQNQADNNDYYDYLYKAIESALNQLGEVHSLNDEGVKMTIDLSNSMSLQEIAEKMDYYEFTDVEDLFKEKIGEEIDTPFLSIDDRYSPYGSSEDFNEYISDTDLEQGYKKGGFLRTKNISTNKKIKNMKSTENKFADGGQIIRFDRHASMDSATRNELVEMTSYPFLLEYEVEENGQIKYDRIESELKREGVSTEMIKNYLSGLFDGYNYSNTDDFKKEMAKLKLVDKEFYDKVMMLYEKISKYPKINVEYADGGRVTTNDGIIESFLTSNKQLKVGNLSTHFNQYDNQMLLRNYGTLIATRIGNDVSITNIKYSKTTTTITNKIRNMALQKRMNISYVDKFAEGGETQKVNLGNGEMDLDEAIKIYEEKIKAQGRVVNARDEDVLEQLKRMKNKFAEGGLTEHGLMEGDKIRKDYSVVYPNEKSFKGIIDVTDKDGEIQIVNLEKGIRYDDGGSVDLDYADILNVLKTKIDASIDEMPMDYENANSFTGEEVEHEFRDGFIPFTDGGYQAVWFEYLSGMWGAGRNLPTKVLDVEMNRQIDYNLDTAKESFVDEFPEIVEKLGLENIDYHSLYEAGYGEEAEMLSSAEMEMMGEDTIMMQVCAYYYTPENSRGFEGENTIRLFGDVNLESPYHRAGNLDDTYEVEFAFSSISELEQKMDKGIAKIISWFNGNMYNESTAEMKIRRMAEGGKTGEKSTKKRTIKKRPKTREPKMVRQYFDDRPYSYAEGGRFESGRGKKVVYRESKSKDYDIKEFTDIAIKKYSNQYDEETIKKEINSNKDWYEYSNDTFLNRDLKTLLDNLRILEIGKKKIKHINKKLKINDTFNIEYNIFFNDEEDTDNPDTLNEPSGYYLEFRTDELKDSNEVDEDVFNIDKNITISYDDDITSFVMPLFETKSETPTNYKRAIKEGKNKIPVLTECFVKFLDKLTNLYYMEDEDEYAEGGIVNKKLLDGFIKRENIIREHFFFIVDENGKKLDDWAYIGDNILRHQEDWDGEDNLSSEDVVTESILKSNGANVNDVDSIIVYDLTNGEQIFNGSQLSDKEWYDYIKYLKENTYQEFAEGGETNSSQKSFLSEKQLKKYNHEKVGHIDFYSKKVSGSRYSGITKEVYFKDGFRPSFAVVFEQEPKEVYEKLKKWVKAQKKNFNDIIAVKYSDGGKAYAEGGKAGAVSKTKIQITDGEEGRKIATRTLIKENKNGERITYELLVGVFKDKKKGYFEIYATDSEDDEYFYAEGGLWIEGGRVVDYDGVYELSEKLKPLMSALNLNSVDVFAEGGETGDDDNDDDDNDDDDYAEGGKTGEKSTKKRTIKKRPKTREPKMVRQYFDDRPYSYAKGGKAEKKYYWIKMDREKIDEYIKYASRMVGMFEGEIYTQAPNKVAFDTEDDMFAFTSMIENHNNDNDFQEGDEGYIYYEELYNGIPRPNIFDRIIGDKYAEGGSTDDDRPQYKKAKSWKDIENHPLVDDTSIEENDPSEGKDYWVYLKNGYCWESPNSEQHIIHEWGVKDTIREFNNSIYRCNCSQCVNEGKYKDGGRVKNIWVYSKPMDKKIRFSAENMSNDSWIDTKSVVNMSKKEIEVFKKQYNKYGKVYIYDEKGKYAGGGSTDDDDDSGAIQEQLDELVQDFSSEEYQAFCYEHDIEEEDAQEMSDFIYSQTNNRCKEIIQEIEDGYYAGGDDNDYDDYAEGGLVVKNNTDLEEVAKYMTNAVKKHRWDLKDLIHYFEKDNNFDYKKRVKIWEDMNGYEMKKTYDNIYEMLKRISEANGSKYAEGGNIIMPKYRVLFVDENGRELDEYFATLTQAKVRFNQYKKDKIETNIEKVIKEKDGDYNYESTEYSYTPDDEDNFAEGGEVDILGLYKKDIFSEKDYELIDEAIENGDIDTTDIKEDFIGYIYERIDEEYKDNKFEDEQIWEYTDEYYENGLPHKENYKKLISYLNNEDEEGFAEGGEVSEWMEQALDSLIKETGNEDLDITMVSNNGNEFFAGNDMEEYRVFKTEEDAEQEAIEQVRDDLQESPENFNQDFIKNYIDGRDFFEAELNEMNYMYVEDISSETSGTKYNNRLIDELVENGLMDEDDAILENAEEIADELKYDYVLLLTEEKLDDGNDGLDYFINNFGENETYGMVVDNNLIDIDKASQDAVDIDGIAHFISSYDGRTLYLSNNNVAYRNN